MRALVLVVAACSSAAPRAAPPPPAPPSATDASVEPPLPNAAACPATLAAANGTCAPEDDVMDVRCVYDQTTCACRNTLDGYCSGAAPGPATSRWTCAPSLRADGCPTIVPRPGTRCRTPDLRCAYSAACCHGELACTNSTWTGSYDCLNAHG